MVPFIPRGTEPSAVPAERSVHSKLQRAADAPLLFEDAINHAVGKASLGKRASNPVQASGAISRNCSPAGESHPPPSRAIPTRLLQSPSQISNQARSGGESSQTHFPINASKQSDNPAKTTESVLRVNPLSAHETVLTTRSAKPAPTGFAAPQIPTSQGTISPLQEERGGDRIAHRPANEGESKCPPGPAGKGQDAAPLSGGSAGEQTQTGSFPITASVRSLSTLAPRPSLTSHLVETQSTDSPARNGTIGPSEPAVSEAPFPSQTGEIPKPGELPVKGAKSTRIGLPKQTRPSGGVQASSTDASFSSSSSTPFKSAMRGAAGRKEAGEHSPGPTQLNPSRVSRTRSPSAVDGSSYSGAPTTRFLQTPQEFPSSPSLNQVRPGREGVKPLLAPNVSAQPDCSRETKELIQALSAVSMGPSLPSLEPVQIPAKVSAAPGRASAQNPAVDGSPVERRVLTSLVKPALEDTKQTSTELPDQTPVPNQPQPSAPALEPIQSESAPITNLSPAKAAADGPKPGTLGQCANDTPLTLASDESSARLQMLDGVGAQPRAASPGQPDTATSPNIPILAWQEVVANESGKDYPTVVGISAAQQEVAMKKGEKVPKNAESALQILPSEGALSAAVHQPAALALDSATQVAVPPANHASDVQLQTLEKTHDLVTTHALRLNHSQNDSMRVVIEPGSGTRLSLELRFANGGIEAQAQLHRGDFDFLSNHWSELQQRLQPQGVTLGALEYSTASGSDQRSAQDTGSFTREEPRPRGALSEEHEFAESRSKVKTRIRQYAGWESWA